MIYDSSARIIRAARVYLMSSAGHRGLSRAGFSERHVDICRFRAAQLLSWHRPRWEGKNGGKSQCFYFQGHVLTLRCRSVVDFQEETGSYFGPKNIPEPLGENRENRKSREREISHDREHSSRITSAHCEEALKRWLDNRTREPASLI